MHASYSLAGTGPYLSQIGLDQRDQGIYGIRRAHNVTHAHKLACIHTIFLHAETKILAKFCPISKVKVSMDSQDYIPHVWTYIRSCQRAGGPKKRQMASHRSQRPPNSPLQELERGVSGGPKISILIYIMLVSVCPLVHWSKTKLKS